MPNDKFVQINGSGDQISVSNPNVHISKNNADQVKWTNNLGVTATVAFEDSPFNTSSYSVGPHGTTPSGPATKVGTYKYSVSAPGHQTLDPTVIVDP